MMDYYISESMYSIFCGSSFLKTRSVLLGTTFYEICLLIFEHSLHFFLEMVLRKAID